MITHRDIVNLTPSSCFLCQEEGPNRKCTLHLRFPSIRPLEVSWCWLPCGFDYALSVGLPICVTIMCTISPLSHRPGDTMAFQPEMTLLLPRSDLHWVERITLLKVYHFIIHILTIAPVRPSAVRWHRRGLSLYTDVRNYCLQVYENTSGPSN